MQILGVFHYSNRSEPLAKFAQLLSSGNSLANSVNFSKNLLYGNKQEPFPGITCIFSFNRLIFLFISKSTIIIYQKNNININYSIDVELRNIINSFVSTPQEQSQAPVVIEEAPKEAPVEVQLVPEVKVEVPEVKAEIKEEAQPELTPPVEVKSEGEPAKEEIQGEQKQEDKKFVYFFMNRKKIVVINSLLL